MTCKSMLSNLKSEPVGEEADDEPGAAPAL
jgi:hypothetical protein